MDLNILLLCSFKTWLFQLDLEGISLDSLQKTETPPAIMSLGR
jgi:hypothetical protein